MPTIPNRHWLAIAALLLGACGNAAPAGRADVVTIGTGSAGGLYEPLGNALAQQLMARDTTLRVEPARTEGSVENVRRVLAEELDLGFAISSAVYEAYHEGVDVGEAGRQLRVVAPLYPNVTHVLVSTQARIRTMAELRGRTVSVGSAGSGTELVARQLLQTYGLEYTTIEPQYLSFAESVAALEAGTIDAAILSVGYPAAAVVAALGTGAARLLPIDAARARSLSDEHAYYSVGTIPAGTYPGLDIDLPTVTTLNWIVAREDLDARVVRAVLQLLHRDRDRLRAVAAIAGQINLANLYAAPIPVHPAVRAWLRQN